MKVRVVTYQLSLPTFLRDERGAVTVDWTVLSAAAVGLALATAAVLTDVNEMLASQMDDELRNRQLSDDWVQFFASHFEPILATGYMTEADAEALHNAAYEMMNHDVYAHLQSGIAALEAGTINAQELTELVAVASIAHQRNLVDDATLDYYFGFDGSDPYYMTVANAPTETYGG